MGLLPTAVHTLAALVLPPDELLARLSDTAARLLSARAAMPPVDPLNLEPLTARCAIAIYDPVELTCTIACVCPDARQLVAGTRAGDGRTGHQGGGARRGRSPGRRRKGIATCGPAAGRAPPSPSPGGPESGA
ncbi:hypothetical protein ABZ904_45860 [Streptomyces sp. NPDC046900]|uniref:hypothetical protein n=1 Tax=Streptomyces sp. NPDC046900 TaxID=3155473 RepID=UPI0033D730A3